MTEAEMAEDEMGEAQIGEAEVVRGLNDKRTIWQEAEMGEYEMLEAEMGKDEMKEDEVGIQPYNKLSKELKTKLKFKQIKQFFRYGSR